jgi:hypothetical protein
MGWRRSDALRFVILNSFVLRTSSAPGKRTTPALVILANAGIYGQGFQLATPLSLGFDGSGHGFPIKSGMTKGGLDDARVVRCPPPNPSACGRGIGSAHLLAAIQPSTCFSSTSRGHRP